MSYDKLRALRTAGEFDQALAIAYQDIEAFPLHAGKKISAAWIHYDLLKKNCSPDKFNVFLEQLEKIRSLDLPDDEQIFFDSCAFQVGKMVYGLKRQKPPDYTKINRLFDIIRNFHFSKPSMAYSFLYKAFHHNYEEWDRYPEFADWWDFSNFSQEDYRDQLYNGRSMMALAQQAYIAYSKYMMELIERSGYAANAEKLDQYLLQLKVIVEKYPEYLYPRYYYTRLLLAAGQTAEARESFIPFAQAKQKDFWVWDLLAKINSDDANLQLACYCKALSIKAADKFLVRVRKDLVPVLIESGHYNEAKTELNQLIRTRQNNGWPVTAEIIEWTRADWYLQAVDPGNNDSFYQKYKSAAELLLTDDIEPVLVAVEFVNAEKKILNFVISREQSGFFNYSDCLDQVRVGDILEVKFINREKTGFSKISEAKITDCQMPEIVKNINEKAIVKNGHTFGFAGNNFVPPEIINKYNIKDGMTINGRAIISKNRKTGVWGWKVVFVANTGKQSM